MTSFELHDRSFPRPGVCLVEVAGELDFTNAHELDVRLGQLAESAAVVLLDLDRLLFVDSAALHVLFRIARDLGPRRFGLVLQPGAAVARTLEIVGLPQVVVVAPTADDALAALAVTHA